MHHINVLKDQNRHVISLDAEKVFDKSTSLHDKSLVEVKDTSVISQHNKGNLQQVHSQHHSKCRKTQNSSTKIRNKTRLATLSIPIQHNT